MIISPALLHQIAREERARRKAAWKAAGQGDTTRAQQDDVIWSNIVQIAGIAARDADCLKRGPHDWTTPERVTMARIAWATACKAEAKLDATIAANHAKIVGLYQLYRWLRPMGWSPLTSEIANG